MAGRLEAWLRELLGPRSKFDVEIPEWPCDEDKTHPWHYWSDGTMGYECPGDRCICPTPGCDVHDSVLSDGRGM